MLKGVQEKGDLCGPSSRSFLQKRARVGKGREAARYIGVEGVGGGKYGTGKRRGGR